MGPGFPQSHLGRVEVMTTPHPQQLRGPDSWHHPTADIINFAPSLCNFGPGQLTSTSFVLYMPASPGHGTADYSS